MRFGTLVLASAILCGCAADDVVCEVDTDDCPADLTEEDAKCEAAEPGTHAELRRPDVCDYYPFGEVYMGALWCGGPDPFGNGDYLVEVWCVFPQVTP